MRRSSPTSRVSMSVVSEICATPFTISSGARSPPMASTAIAGISPSLAWAARGAPGGTPAHALAHPHDPTPPPTALREIAGAPPGAPRAWRCGRGALCSLAGEARAERALVDAVLEGLAAVHAGDGDFGAG